MFVIRTEFSGNSLYDVESGVTIPFGLLLVVFPTAVSRHEKHTVDRQSARLAQSTFVCGCKKTRPTTNNSTGCDKLVCTPRRGHGNLVPRDCPLFSFRILPSTKHSRGTCQT